jgi:hypothetical protein
MLSQHLSAPDAAFVHGMMAYTREHNDGSEGTPMQAFSTILAAALAVDGIVLQWRGEHAPLLPPQKSTLTGEPVFPNLLIEGMEDAPS